MGHDQLPASQCPYKSFRLTFELRWASAMTWFLSTRVGQRMHAWWAGFVGSGYSGALAILLRGTGIGPEEVGACLW